MNIQKLIESTNAIIDKYKPVKPKSEYDIKKILEENSKAYREI